MVAVQLPMPLVTLFIAGILCISFVGVMAVALMLEGHSASEHGGVAGSVVVAGMVFGVFYGVGWLALPYL